MQRRALGAVALALGIVSTPSIMRAQNRNLPGADTPRLLVVVLQSPIRVLGVEVADAIRQRFTSQMNPRALFITPREVMVNFLESSGYKADSSLGTSDLKELGRGLRSDILVGGLVTKVGTNMHVEPRMMLAVDPTVGQPLPVIESTSLPDIGRQVERAVQEARKQLEDDKACKNHIRSALDQNGSVTNAAAVDKAIAAANAGVQKYPNAVIARLCLANAYQVKKMWDSVLSVTETIKRLDATSKLAITFQIEAYKAKADGEADPARSQQYRESSVRLLVALLAVDPYNQGLQNSVISELAKLGKPAIAIPIIDGLLKQNPGDPQLLQRRWQLMLADAAGADSASKPAKLAAALAAGEDMVKADTTLADSTYYARQVAAAMSPASPPQKGVEWTSRAVQKYPTNQDYWWYRARSENSAGQIQASQQSLSRLLVLNPKYPSATLLLGQLFLQQNMSDSAVALARRAVANGEDAKQWGTFLLRPTQESMKKAQTSEAAAKADTMSKEKAATAVADWATMLDLAQETDKLNPAAFSKFFVGLSSFQVGLGNYNLVIRTPAPKPVRKGRPAPPDARCAPAKKAQDMFLLTQLNMPQGGSVDAATAGQLLGYVNQLAPTIDQMVKTYCK